LNPGQEATLNTVFDPTAVGASAGQLTISSNSSSNAKSVISLSGTGTAAPAALSLLSCSSGAITGAGTDACTVMLTGAAPGGGLTVKLSSNSSAVTVPSTMTVPAGADSAEFTASVASVAAAQPVTITASVGSIVTSFTLQLNATIRALSINPVSLGFGNVVVNTPTSQSITLTSTDTAPVTISSANLTGAGFTISGASFPATLNPGQAVSLSVQFDPTAAGAATGQLTITSNSSTNGTPVISLSGTGTTGKSAAVLSALYCSSGAMMGSGADACTLTLSASAPSGGLILNLSSSNSAVTVPN
jgi:hypothetical protein